MDTVSVVYVGPHDAVVLSDGREFKNGEPVEVDADLADALTAQGFKINKGKAVAK